MGAPGCRAKGRHHPRVPASRFFLLVGRTIATPSAGEKAGNAPAILIASGEIAYSRADTAWLATAFTDLAALRATITVGMPRRCLWARSHCSAPAIRRVGQSDRRTAEDLRCTS